MSTTHSPSQIRWQVILWFICVLLAGLLHPLMNDIGVIFHDTSTQTHNSPAFGVSIFKTYALIFISASVSTGIFINYVYKTTSTNLNLKVFNGLIFVIILMAITITYANLRINEELTSEYKTLQLSIFCIASLYIITVKYIIERQ